MYDWGQLAKSLSRLTFLYDWSERTLLRFNADLTLMLTAIRAQVERWWAIMLSPAEQESTIRRDLEGLEGVRI